MLMTLLALEDVGLFVRVVGRTGALLNCQAPLLAILLRILVSLLVEHALVPRLDRHSVKQLLLLTPVHIRKVTFRAVRRRSD